MKNIENKHIRTLDIQSLEAWSEFISFRKKKWHESTNKYRELFAEHYDNQVF